MIGNWISSDWMQRLAGSLLHFVWEGAALAFVAAVLLRLLQRRSAASRYAVSVGILGLMLLAPLATYVFYAETGAAAKQVLQFLRPPFAEAGRAAGAAGIVWWTDWIVTLWIVGAVVCWTRLMGGWILSLCLIRSAKAAVPERAYLLLERVRAALPVRRSVRLRIGEHVSGPVVFGWLRPVVLLPVSALTGLNEDQLLAVLAHELAHVRRHDFLVNAMQRAVESVLFYHPAVWWLSGRIRIEREHCCDDLAVGVCGDRLVYAQALVELERSRTSAPALAVPAASGRLTGRIRRLIGSEEANRDWLPAAVALLLVAVCAVAGAGRTVIAAAPAGPLTAIVLPPIEIVMEGTVLSTQPEPSPVEGAVNAAVAILTAQATPSRGPSAPVVISAAREVARRQLSELHVDYSVETFVKQAAEGDAIVVRTFLDAGMNPNLIAVYDFVRTIYKDGLPSRESRPEMSTALIAAAANGQTEILQLLLAAKADVTLKTQPTAATALVRAATHGHLDAVRILLAAGTDPEPQSGSAALLEAARIGHESVVRALLESGVAPNPESSSDDPAVYSAACGGHVGVLRALLDKGGDRNARSRSFGTTGGVPALLCAVQFGKRAAVALLTERGADVNATDSSRRTAVETAVSVERLEGRLEIISLLLDKGANINQSMSNGGVPLWTAIGHLDVARGRFPGNEQDRERTAVVNLLIARGANVNVMSSTGITPLHSAARSGFTDIVQTLLAKGADVSAVTSKGQSVLQAAKSPEVAQILRDAGAK